MARFYSIRFRLTAMFLAIILAVMLIISLFLYSILERYHMNNLLEHLQRTGFLASDFLVRSPPRSDRHGAFKFPGRKYQPPGRGKGGFYR